MKLLMIWLLLFQVQSITTKQQALAKAKTIWGPMAKVTNPKVGVYRVGCEPVGTTTFHYKQAQSWDAAFALVSTANGNGPHDVIITNPNGQSTKARTFYVCNQ